MKKGKKLTYVNLPADDTFHAGFEKALEQVQMELGRSHPIIIGGRELFPGPESEVLSPIDRRIVVGKFQEATPVLSDLR